MTESLPEKQRCISGDRWRSPRLPSSFVDALPPFAARPLRLSNSGGRWTASSSGLVESGSYNDQALTRSFLITPLERDSPPRSDDDADCTSPPGTRRPTSSFRPHRHLNLELDPVDTISGSLRALDGNESFSDFFQHSPSHVDVNTEGERAPPP